MEFDDNMKDPATGGPNSVVFDNEAKRLISENKGDTFSFVVCDICDFGNINTLYGIDAGNRVLAHVYTSLSKFLTEDDLLCRLSGDRFNLLLANKHKTGIDHREWPPIFELICNIGGEGGLDPKAFKDMPYIKLNVGIYSISDPEEDLIVIRDKAISAVKSKNVKQTSSHVTIGTFGAEDEYKRTRESIISHKMVKAIADEDFEVWIQPKLNLSNGYVTGGEALVRWNDAELGMVSPGEFIPIMEKYGFVNKVDLFVFEECCAMIRDWIDKGYNPIRLSSNFSGRHLENEEFVEELLYITDKYKVSPTYLEIEFTESVFFGSLYSRKVAERLHDAGFLLSIDDLGGGFSTISLISELEVDILKLDRTFFQNAFFPSVNKQYVMESLIKMGHELGMEVVVEGVENDLQLQFMTKAGCDMAQGFSISKPVSKEEFVENFIKKEYCKESIRELADYLREKREAEGDE
ncbi:MAG: EAL domain-containing protein [Lachnospiraceae bacterium]|jgi:EAL domain-containing protein (putative c-di-GMP-specific phosphodiesterase class I)/GGDEF domain-containing protein|nr:EAL domain-containing protein [Lachnospiraceae bacterium]